jgi:hypothetical protein
MTPLQFELIVFLTDKIITILTTLRRVAQMEEEELKAAIPEVRKGINELVDQIKKL